MFEIIIFSIVAGLVGTGLGGLVGLLCCNKGEKAVKCVLGFAGGVMVTVVLTELLPEAINMIAFSQKKPFVVIVGLILGAAMIWVLDFWVSSYKKEHRIGKQKHLQQKPSLDKKIGAMANKKPYFSQKKENMLFSGILMLTAIALHNFPEGLALGSSGAISQSNAISLTILLALHNIPEGMAISVPLANGGAKPLSAALLAAAGGAVTVLGAIVGFALGSVSPFFISACLSMAGGAMLFVTFAEIFPQSVFDSNSKLPFLCALAGIFVASVAMFV